MKEKIKELICIEQQSPQQLTHQVNTLVGDRSIQGEMVSEIESVSVVYSDGIYRAFVLVAAFVTGGFERC